MRAARTYGGLFGALVICFVLIALPAANAANGTTRFLVGFKSKPGANESNLVTSVGGKVAYKYDLIPAMAVDLTSSAAAKLAKESSISYVEQEVRRTPFAHIVPGQLFTGSPEILPWGVEKVRADDVWDPDHNLTVNAGRPAGQGVKVAVLDSGVDITHPDLAANLDLADSFDFVDGDTNVSDVPGAVTGHGTSTSGIVAAVDNNIGVIGTAPKATVIMYRVCDSSVAPLGDCPDSAIIGGLQEAVKDGADVVSMSFGGLGFSQGLKQAIAAVGDAGIVQVASAGNEPTPVAGARNYPAGFSQVISVGATDIDDNIASFSTFGGHQELVAPGVETPTTFLQGQGRDATFEENSPTAGLDFEPNPMEFTALGNVTAGLVSAGLGQPADFAAVNCTGKIALISRGTITFAAKVDNAIADGCVAAVIYNNAPGNFNGTLGAPKALPAVSLSQAEGQSLVASLDRLPVNVTLTIIANDYTSFSGTSASAPYVSGVAALVLSANPSLSNVQVRDILDRTARPLGPSQRSIYYGHGLVDALAAVNAAG